MRRAPATTRRPLKEKLLLLVIAFLWVWFASVNIANAFIVQHGSQGDISSYSTCAWPEQNGYAYFFGLITVGIPTLPWLIVGCFLGPLGILAAPITLLAIPASYIIGVVVVYKLLSKLLLRIRK